MARSATSQRHWVTVGVIQCLTGWKWPELRMARKNNLVHQERMEIDGKTVIRYDLNSLRPEFIIKRYYDDEIL
jgi:hypothetical protein